jgi:hypothetical protein
MKVGGESRVKVILLAVLALGATISLIYMFSSLGGSSTPQVARAQVPHGNTTARPGTRGPALAIAANSLDPELRLKLLESSEGMKYEGSGRNIFVPSLEVIPNPVDPGLRGGGKSLPPPPPLPPPGPPPIPLKFFGFASHAGEPTRIFLAQNDTVFIAYEGQIVDRRYKVLRITPNSVEIEDVLNNNRQTIPIS